MNSRDDDDARLNHLAADIERARAAQKEPARKPDGKYAAMSMAWRMVIELLAGIVIGVGIGYGLDSLFGTQPLLMIPFGILGFAAGVRTMVRSAEEMGDGSKRSEEADGPDRDGD